MSNLEELQSQLVAARALLANVPDAVVLVGPSGLVSEANAAAQALLPMLRLGHPLSYGVRAPEILEAITQAFASGRPLQVAYHPRLPAERAFEVQLAPVAARHGAGPDGVMLFFRDVTAARRVEQMRVDFVANASHELRTPLASLLGFIETLQGPARDDPAARDRFLETMRGQAWRMARLIDDLLSLSRIELREHLAPGDPVDLWPLTCQTVDTLRPMAGARGVEISVAVPAESVCVLGDRDELLRVVENLVENAVRYGESGRRVDVALARAGGEVGLSVRDYGPGIAEEYLPRLTERFYRVDVAESRAKGGTGLGLAIVKHIVNRHRGRLVIESRPGEGALFRVVLPAAETPLGM